MITMKHLCNTIDGIIIGGSSLKHIISNLDVLEDGPLDPSKITSAIKYYVHLCLILFYRCGEGF